jgi:hypothetical protein
MPGEYSTPWKILQLEFWSELRLSGEYAHNKEKKQPLKKSLSQKEHK